ncbi:MAG: hypothetical protein AAF264_14015 [Pseudomonadota bacterium]
MIRAVVIFASLALLGGAGYASWYGLGTVSRDTGASVRTGSVGGVIVGGVPRRARVK